MCRRFSMWHYGTCELVLLLLLAGARAESNATNSTPAVQEQGINLSLPLYGYNNTTEAEVLADNSREELDFVNESQTVQLNNTTTPLPSKTPNADRMRTARPATAAQLIESALLQVMSDSIGDTDTNGTDKAETDCDRIASPLLWHSAVHAQCVAHAHGFLLEWPYDIYSSVYPCGLGAPGPDANGTYVWPHRVHIMNTSEFLDEVSHPRGRETNWCFLINLYTPYCPYSAQLADVYNALPRYFPSLYVVAIDARDFVRHPSTSRYGVAGTPTLMLWHNGRAVARFAGSTHTLSSIHMFLTRWTDLQRDRRVVASVDDQYGPLSPVPTEETDWYLVMAVLFLLCTAVYHGMRSSLAQGLLDNLQKIWREANETVPQDDDGSQDGRDGEGGQEGGEDELDERQSQSSSDSYQDVLETDYQPRPQTPSTSSATAAAADP